MLIGTLATVVFLATRSAPVFLSGFGWACGIGGVAVYIVGIAGYLTGIYRRRPRRANGAS